MKLRQPLILGIGGTLREGSSSEQALKVALGAAEELGARTCALTGSDLDLPYYAPDNVNSSPAVAQLVEAYRACDGLIISSPGYHGSISGMLKNALDYIEELRNDPRVYLDGLPIGCIACAYGWQATGTTMMTLRSVVHALRGWPTPLAVTINSAETRFDGNARCSDVRASSLLHTMAGQVVTFAQEMVADPAANRSRRVS